MPIKLVVYKWFSKIILNRKQKLECGQKVNSRICQIASTCTYTRRRGDISTTLSTRLHPVETLHKIVLARTGSRRRSDPIHVCERQMNGCHEISNVSCASSYLNRRQQRVFAEITTIIRHSLIIYWRWAMQQWRAQSLPVMQFYSFA